MREAWMALSVALGLAGSAGARDVQLGQLDGVEASVPLENHPSLGVFVLANINGHGPYRFAIDPSQPTRLTPYAVRDAGLVFDGPSKIQFNTDTRQILDVGRVKAATLQIGGKVVSIDGADVMSERDLSAYMPVPAYGGSIGVELFRRNAVRMDFPRSMMTLMPTSAAAPPQAIDIPLHQSGVGSGFDRQSSVSMTLDGRQADLFLGPGGGAISFISISHVGSDVFRSSPYEFSEKLWSPDGVSDIKRGIASDVRIGATTIGPAYIDLSAQPLNQLSHWRLVTPFIDGVIGVGAFRAFAITINVFSGEAWLEPSPAGPSPCPLPSRSPRARTLHPPAALGFLPWLYRGRGIVRALATGGPADLAGMRPGDEIVSINGVDVVAYYQKLDATCLAMARVATTVVFKNRSGPHTLTLTPAEPKYLSH